MASGKKDILLGMVRNGLPMTLGQQIRLTIPVGALGTVFPSPLASLRSDGFVLGSFWVRLYWYILLSKSKDFV